MSEKFQDKYRIPSARLRNWDYSADGIYFITICTASHECFFGEIANKKMRLSEIGSLVQMEWEKSFIIRAELFCDYFVIMPNHIHAILRIENKICEHTGCKLNNTGLNVTRLNDIGINDTGLNDMGVNDLVVNDVKTHGRASLQDRPYQQHDNIFEQNTLHSKFGVAYRPPKSISSFVAGFKSAVTINARKIHADFAWQTRFHDHIIHADPEYQRIANYIENNPANWEEDKYFGKGSV